MFIRSGIICGSRVVAFKNAVRIFSTSPKDLEHRNDSTSLSLSDFYPEILSHPELEKDLKAMQDRLQKKRSRLLKLTIKADQMEANGRKAEAAVLHEKILAEGNSVSYIGSALKAARLYMSIGDEAKAMKFIELIESSILRSSFTSYIEALKLEKQNRHEEASNKYRLAFEEFLSKNLLQSTLSDKN